MDDHLGYEKSERFDSDDYRNGYKRKCVNSSYGAMEIEVPQDIKSKFGAPGISMLVENDMLGERKRTISLIRGAKK